jgi:hypothetical protein
MVPVPLVNLYTLYPDLVGWSYVNPPEIEVSAALPLGYAIITMPEPPAAGDLAMITAG